MRHVIYAAAALGLAEDELLGRDWFATAIPPRDRHLHRSAFAQMLAGEPVTLPSTPGVNWRWSLSVDEDGRPIGALGWGDAVPLPRLVAASAR